MFGLKLQETEQSECSPVVSVTSVMRGVMRGVVRSVVRSVMRLVVVGWNMLLWLGLVDVLLGRLNISVRGLSLVRSLRSVDGEVSVGSVNTQPWLGSSNFGLSLRSPEIDIRGFPVLTDGRSSILG